MDSNTERKHTRDLFIRLNGFALILPFIAAAFVIAYFQIEGRELSRSDWKTITFLVWLSMILILGLDVLRSVRSGRLARRSSTQRKAYYRYAQSPGAGREKENLLNKWEAKRVKRLLKEVAKTIAIVPSLTVLILASYSIGLGTPIFGHFWRELLLLVGLGTFLAALKSALRFFREPILYSKEKKAVASA